MLRGVLSPPLLGPVGANRRGAFRDPIHPIPFIHLTHPLIADKTDRKGLVDSQ